jgi:hypothetical protein
VILIILYCLHTAFHFIKFSSSYIQEGKRSSTGLEGPDGEQRCRSTFPLTLRLDVVVWVVKVKLRLLYPRERHVTHFFYIFMGPCIVRYRGGIYDQQMRQIHNIYCWKCSTCFGVSLPIIRSSELYVQPYGVISCEVLSSVG